MIPIRIEIPSTGVMNLNASVAFRRMASVNAATAS
jgi:hypothetical protein